LLDLPADAANYYVNSRFGNDDNAGTAKEAPWKSLENLSNKFLPEDNILFAKGSAIITSLMPCYGSIVAALNASRQLKNNCI
jgi:hypothetical protein